MFAAVPLIDAVKISPLAPIVCTVIVKSFVGLAPPRFVPATVNVSVARYHTPGPVMFKV